MNNTSPGGWQNYSQGTNAQWVVNPQNTQGPFGQNGGNMTMQQPQDPQFVGRFINHIEEVMPREIPMDGRPAIFPTQTLEEIYLKAWDRNGTIKTFRYILDPTQVINTSQTEVGPNILERLEQLEQRLGEVQQSKNTNRRNNKGGENNAEP